MILAFLGKRGVLNTKRSRNVLLPFGERDNGFSTSFEIKLQQARIVIFQHVLQFLVFCFRQDGLEFFTVIVQDIR
jgi:hypothetical protein